MQHVHRCSLGFSSFSNQPTVCPGCACSGQPLRTGHGPENLTPLRRFAIGILKSFQTTESIAQMMRKLCFYTRRVFDYLRMTKNSAPEHRAT